MRQVIACVAITVAGLMVSQIRVGGQEQPGTIRTDNPTLRASLDRIARGSALWRADLQTARQTGRPVLVFTPDEVVVVDQNSDASAQAFDAGVLAEISVIPGNATAVEGVMVVVNLPLLDDAHNRRRSSAAERAADLDRILIHEIYGHALPYVVAGDLSGRCADPARGQPASEACSIQRENAVRAELGLGRRKDYGLGSLALARPQRQSR